MGTMEKTFSARQVGWLKQFWRPVHPAELPPEARFEYDQFLHRASYFVYIKAVFNVLMLVLFVIVLDSEMRSGPLLTALGDGLLILPYIFLVRRWPGLSTYVLLSTTALAISAADIAAGYQTGTSGVLYALLIVGGAVVLIETRSISAITTLITAVYVLTFALEVTGIIPVQVTLSPMAVARVLAMHIMAFISLGVLSNTLINLYRQLLQTRLQRGLLEALLEGFQGISGELQLHALLQRIADRAVSTIPSADRAILLLQENNSLVIQSLSGYGDALLRGLSVSVEKIAPYLEKAPIQGSNPEEILFQVIAPRFLDRISTIPLSKTAALFPLQAKGSLYGVLVVSNLDRTNAFDADTMQILELFAHQAAIAIENARLFETAQSRLQEALALHQIGQEIASRLEMYELVPTIYRHIQQAISAPSFLLALRGPTTEDLTLHSPVDSGQVLPDIIVPPQGILGWVIRHRQALRLGDIERELDRYPDISYQRHGLPESYPHSLLAVPLVVGKQVVGAISVQSPNIDQYDDRDEQFLTSLASYVAVAIQNARLYDEVQQKAHELEQKQQELQHLIEAVSRQLQRPVEIISGFSQLLQNEVQDRLTGDERDYLDRIRRNAQWVSWLIQDMAFLARLDQVQEEPEILPLSTLAVGVCTNLGLTEQGIRVHIQQEMPSVYADSVLMWTCLRNLLQNIRRLIYDAAEPCLEIGCDVLEEGYRLHIQSNGLVLSQEQREHLFDLFFPVEGYAPEGLGIGLVIAQQVCQRYGGRIWAEPGVAGGTTFYILLPKPFGQ